MLMLRLVVLALALATAQAQNLTPGKIAGYNAVTMVDDYLKKDLIQEELEGRLQTSAGKEDCPSFAIGKSYYFDDTVQPDEAGRYLRSIPTYGNGVGEQQSNEYKEYIKWSGNKNFHKKWVEAAFDKGSVAKGEMVADFTVFPNDVFNDARCVGFEECVKKATSYVYNFLEVVQLMQASIESAKDGCIYQQDSCETAVKYWDASVAIYVGSLEGEFGRSGTGGKSNYALANKRCRNFKNCGPERNEGSSKDRISPVNTKILATFSAGQHAAFAGDWALMEDYKKLISAKMVVPWIQGTLRYAWRLSSERARLDNALTSAVDPLKPNGNVNFDDQLKLPADLSDPTSADPDYSILDKEVGEAAAFALGAVPKLWACSKKAAQLVWPQLGPGQGVAGVAPVNFQLVKTAFECNYKCLLTSCTEVGSLYDGVDREDLINSADSPDTVDEKVDIKNGALTCDDAEYGTDPKGYKKCTKQDGPIRKKRCKALTGQAGVGQRAAPEYFAETVYTPPTSTPPPS